MNITTRQYDRRRDFSRVSDFLIRHYRPNNEDGNWLEAVWQYMHSHPYLDESSLERIRLWECGGEPVGVVHYESDPGEVFFEVHPEFKHLKREMFEYAETNLKGMDGNGNEYVRMFINDFDAELEEYARRKGYRRDEEGHRPMSKFHDVGSVGTPELPDGFSIISQDDENDLMKFHAVLWHGFNHPGEPPMEGIRHGIEGRTKMQSVPGYDKSLKIIVRNERGEYVSFCGFWYDAVNRVALIEPMATHPRYRRMGLGRAAVYEGIRRCRERGAKEAYVGSDQEFYLAVGFEKIFTTYKWVR